jgi:uncharacterized protein YegP (UPF0339 family)/outer membrane murein-binding lipoprotein Lpp
MSYSADNALVATYEERFGTPFTRDEVYGYWAFVAGTLVAVLGMVLFLVSMGGGRTGIREVAYLLAGSGLAAAFAGLVAGQAFHRGAKRLVYLGLVVCLAAMAWFLTVFPSGWALSSGGAQGVVVLYTVGLALITLSGAIAPVSVGQSRARREVESRLEAARADDAADDARIAELGDDVSQKEARIDDLEGDLADTEAHIAELEEELAAARDETQGAREEATQAMAAADEANADLQDAAAHLRVLEESSATFDVYRDNADEWRWRLVHTNGNIIAASGQGYSSDRSARRGMRSVKRNSLGAAVVWQRDEPEPDPLVDPVAADPAARFELYRDADEEYRWRLRHDNGNTLAAATRGFSSKSAAEDGLAAMRSAVGPADYLEFDPAGIEVYEDAGGEFRWRLVHRNGNILGDSAEGYVSRSNARRAADRFRDLAGEAELDADSGARIETFEDRGGDHRWRLVAANGETVADSSQGYSSRSELERAVERVREYAPGADRLTMGRAALEVYEDAGGEFRWRLRHRNGTILGTSGEGYASRSGAVEGINRVKRHAPNAPTEEADADDDTPDDAGA